MLKSLRVISLQFLWLPVISKMPFYAVAKGRTPGIFMNWADCEAQVKGFSGARYKKFDVITAAQEFIEINGNTNTEKGAPYANMSNSSGKRCYSATKQESKLQEKNTLKRNTEESEEAKRNLGAVIEKQLDGLEKRVDHFGKGIDKIYKKGSKITQKKTILLEPPPNKRSRKKSDDAAFNIDNEGFVHVYTDGACSSNGRNGARAGLGVYWGDGHYLNTSEPVSGRATNNCGEIQAATKAINIALKNGVTKLAINTDSKFLINSVTKWMPGWKRKGWKLKSGEPVKNQVDFMDLDSVQNKLQIKWNYVQAHQGIHGNEMADQLAKSGAEAYEYK